MFTFKIDVDINDIPNHQAEIIKKVKQSQVLCDLVPESKYKKYSNTLCELQHIINLEILEILKEYEIEQEPFIYFGEYINKDI